MSVETFEYHHSVISIHDETEIYRAADSGKVVVFDETKFPDPISKVQVSIESDSNIDGDPAYIFSTTIDLRKQKVSRIGYGVKIAGRQAAGLFSPTTHGAIDLRTIEPNCFLYEDFSTDTVAVATFAFDRSEVTLSNRREFLWLPDVTENRLKRLKKVLDPPSKGEISRLESSYLAAFMRLTVRAVEDAHQMRRGKSVNERLWRTFYRHEYTVRLSKSDD